MGDADLDALPPSISAAGAGLKSSQTLKRGSWPGQVSLNGGEAIAGSTSRPLTPEASFEYVSRCSKHFPNLR